MSFPKQEFDKEREKIQGFSQQLCVFMREITIKGSAPTVPSNDTNKDIYIRLRYRHRFHLDPIHLSGNTEYKLKGLFAAILTIKQLNYMLFPKNDYREKRSSPWHLLEE